MTISLKISRFFFGAIMTPAALGLFGCSKQPAAATTVDPAAAGPGGVAVGVHASASDSWTWDSIKNFSYEKRTEFSAGIDRMAGQLDDKTRELKTRLADAPEDTAGSRESALRQYDEARADLKSNLAGLNHATADTWAEAKQKVGQAWARVQTAYNKVTSSDAS